jgi:hypothetical protein
VSRAKEGLELVLDNKLLATAIPNGYGREHGALAYLDGEDVPSEIIFPNPVIGTPRTRRTQITTTS